MIHSPNKYCSLDFLYQLQENNFCTDTGKEYSEEEVEILILEKLDRIGLQQEAEYNKMLIEEERQQTAILQVYTRGIKKEVKKFVKIFYKEAQRKINKMNTTLNKTTITIRLNADLLKILKDNNINISAVCRNSLEQIAQQLMDDKQSVKMPHIRMVKFQ